MFRHGASLLETLVVLTMMVLLAGMIVPSFLGRQPEAQLASSADEVRSAVYFARAFAVRESCVLSARISDDGKRVHFSQFDGVDRDEKPLWSDLAAAWVKRGVLPEGLRFARPEPPDEIEELDRDESVEKDAGLIPDSADVLFLPDGTFRCRMEEWVLRSENGSRLALRWFPRAGRVTVGPPRPKASEDKETESVVTPWPDKESLLRNEPEAGPMGSEEERPGLELLGPE